MQMRMMSSVIHLYPCSHSLVQRLYSRGVEQNKGTPAVLIAPENPASYETRGSFTRRGNFEIYAGELLSLKLHFLGSTYKLHILHLKGLALPIRFE
jgi:hypothetical protein